MNLKYLPTLACLAFAPFCLSQTQPQPHNLKEQALLFLENKGQVLDFDNNPRPDVLFMMRAKGINVFVGKGELHYLFSQPKVEQEVAPKGIARVEYKEPDQYAGEGFIENMPDTATTIYETYRIDISLVGMNPDAVVEALEQDPYYENYYNIPGHYTEGILNVRSFEKIIMRNVYPHIDWILYSKNGKLKHEFLLHPGADYRNIRIAVKGATDMLVNANGELELSTPQGTIMEDKPFIPENPEIQGAFLLNKISDLEYEIGYELIGITEIKSALTIDPGIEWSTYFGGTGGDLGVASSSYQRQLYFGGSTRSSDYISQNAYQDSLAGKDDIYVAKFAQDGSKQWATFFGGTLDDYIHNLKAISKGVIVSGVTFNSGLGYNSFDTSFSTPGNVDGLLFLLSPTGALKWSAYVGGNAEDYLVDVGLLNNGSYVVSGFTNTSGLGTSGVHQTTKDGGFDNFIAVIDSAAKKLVWFSYYGSTEEEINRALLCIGDDIYISGSTSSNSKMAKNGFQMSYGGGTRDGYIAKFDTAGSLIWASYYGSTAMDMLCDIAECNGDIYIIGGSFSTSGMVFGNAFQNSNNGGQDVVLARVTSGGKLIWSTYFGGNGDQVGRGCVIDRNGKLWAVIAHTGGLARLGKNLYYDFPLTTNSNTDLLIVRFDTSCKYLDGTYYFGVVNYGTPSNYPSFSTTLGADSNNVYTNLADNEPQSFTIRCNYQSKRKSPADALFVKWNINSFAQPKIIFETPTCPGGKLKIYSEQYAVGRSPNAKTITQLSDSNGVFNSNSRILYTRNDTLSRYEYISATIPTQCPPSKNYRVRMLLNNPPDSSEPSLPFEIHQRPKGEIVPLLSYEVCDNDSLKLELDTLGNNKVRWYRLSVPTDNPGDTNRIFYAKQGGKHSALLTNPQGCTYLTNSVSILQWQHSQAGFISKDTQQCFEGNSFDVKDSSKTASGDVIVSLVWYFGDGQTSTLFNPTHNYSQPGSYQLKLGIGTQRGCHDTAYQTINVWPEPIAKIHKDTSLQCLRGNKFTFTDSSEILADSIAKREWRIGSSLVNTQTQFQHSFTSTGTYTISLDVETAHGCKDNTSTSVRVSGNPIAVIQASKPGFCPGDSVKLEVTNPNTWDYQWYESGTMISNETKTVWHAKAGGNYSVRAITNDGCDTVSNVVNVIAYANPKPDLGADRTIKYDSSAVLNAGTFKNYTWSKGTTTSTFTANKTNLDTGTNTIWVLVTDSNGCKGSDTVVVRLEPVNSIKNIAFSGIKIYPVPAENILHIEFPFWNNSAQASHDLSTPDYNFNLISSDGRTVLSGAINTQNTALDISTLAAGTYLLELDLNGEKYVAKVVK